MEGLHEGSARTGPLHTPGTGISSSIYLGIHHSLLCTNTPRAEPLEVGGAGREGVRQEAQGPIPAQGPVPALTQHCRETSDVPPAAHTSAAVTQHGSVHG